MQGNSTVVVLGSVAVIALGLLGWQSWNTHQLQEQMESLQQQVTAQQLTPPLAATNNPLSTPGPLSAPNALTSPSTPANPPANQINPNLLPPAPVQPPMTQANPSAPGGDPFWGGQDPFEEMQRMQQQMHQHMQELMNGFGLGSAGASLFDMDPFQGGPGFGSSMGFGAEPEFEFEENKDNYQVSISIPQGSNVEVSTSTQGNNLTIEGKVTVEQSNQANGSAFRSQQTRQFARTLQLPDNVDLMGLTNETRGDHVVITIPKKAKTQL